MNYTDYTYNPSDWTKHRDRDSNSVWWENVNTGKTVYNDPAIASDSLLNELYNPNFGQEVAGISDGGLTSIGLHLNPLNAPVDYGNGITSSYTRAPTGFVNELTGRSFVQNPDGSTSPYTGQAGIPTVRYDPNAGNAGHGSWWDQQGTELVGDALYGAAGYFGGPIAGAMLSLGQDNSAESKRNMRMNSLGGLAASASNLFGGSTAGTSTGTGVTSNSGNTQYASGYGTGQTDVPIGEANVSDFDNLVSNDQYANYDSTDYNLDNPASSNTNYANYDPADYRMDNPGDFPPNDPGGPTSSGLDYQKLLEKFGPGILQRLLGPGAQGNTPGNGPLGSGPGTNTSNSYKFDVPGSVGGLLEFLARSQNADYLKQARDQAIQASDPFASQRGAYQNLLSQSYQNPDQVLNGPVFGGIRNMTVNDTARAMAARGYNMSGNEQQQIASRLQDEAMKYYQPYQSGLAQLAGGNANPGYAGLVGLEGAKQVAGADLGKSGALGNLFNTVWNGQQPSLVQQLFGGQSSNNNLGQTLGLS